MGPERVFAVQVLRPILARLRGVCPGAWANVCKQWLWTRHWGQGRQGCRRQGQGYRPCEQRASGTEGSDRVWKPSNSVKTFQDGTAHTMQVEGHEQQGPADPPHDPKEWQTGASVVGWSDGSDRCQIQGATETPDGAQHCLLYQWAALPGGVLCLGRRGQSWLEHTTHVGIPSNNPPKEEMV